MQNDSKLLDDLARMVNGAAGLALDIKREIEGQVQAVVERLLGRMNLVTREEFEVVRTMTIKAREENERLLKRIESLEE